jgi:hypothetical protein
MIFPRLNRHLLAIPAVCDGFSQMELREEYMCYWESEAGLRLCHSVACS